MKRYLATSTLLLAVLCSSLPYCQIARADELFTGGEDYKYWMVCRNENSNNPFKLHIFKIEKSSERIQGIIPVYYIRVWGYKGVHTPQTGNPEGIKYYYQKRDLTPTEPLKGVIQPSQSSGRRKTKTLIIKQSITTDAGPHKNRIRLPNTEDYEKIRATFVARNGRDPDNVFIAYGHRTFGRKVTTEKIICEDPPVEDVLEAPDPALEEEIVEEEPPAEVPYEPNPDT